MEDDVNDAAMVLPERPVDTTPIFNELNPAIQTMVMLYLTGNIPGEVSITDEVLRRSPTLNSWDKVEVLVTGYRDDMMLRTRITMEVYINGVQATPWKGHTSEA